MRFFLLTLQWWNVPATRGHLSCRDTIWVSPSSHVPLYLVWYCVWGGYPGEVIHMEVIRNTTARSALPYFNYRPQKTARPIIKRVVPRALTSHICPACGEKYPSYITKIQNNYAFLMMQRKNNLTAATHTGFEPGTSWSRVTLPIYVTTKWGHTILSHPWLRTALERKCSFATRVRTGMFSHTCVRTPRRVLIG